MGSKYQGFLIFGRFGGWPSSSDHRCVVIRAACEGRWAGESERPMMG